MSDSVSAAPNLLRCGRYSLDLSRPQVMGILNATPDSFSDGGSYYREGCLALDVALSRAEQMVAQGASIIDVGGESTRPGAAVVSAQEELDRVAPLVEALVSRLGVLVSVDTSTPEVMRESARLGAGMINDVRALLREGALQAAAQTGLPVCLMHMQGQPGSMQQQPSYGDVVGEVKQFLQGRVAACQAAGIAAERLLLDPGFGFGKSLAHNLALLRQLPQLAALGFPLLVGLSRKSMLGQLLGRPVEQRLAGSLALALCSAQAGAHIIRVHDVAETVDTLRVWQALREAPGAAPQTFQQ